MSGAAPTLTLADVTKTYGADPPVPALQGVSFTVAAGELVAIVGPSGSGKSTLLHLMGTLERPTSGRVSVTGLDVSELSDRELASVRATRIGFVFQQFFLAEHSTLLENVADGLLYAGVPVEERRAQAARALAAVGLGERLKARPTQLSGGERQRVAIARALSNRPEIIVADEPTGALDTTSTEQVFAILREIADQGRTVVVVTHDPALAARADRRIHIVDGKVAQTVEGHAGAPEAAVAAPTEG